MSPWTSWPTAWRVAWEPNGASAFTPVKKKLEHKQTHILIMNYFLTFLSFLSFLSLCWEFTCLKSSGQRCHLFLVVHLSKLRVLVDKASLLESLVEGVQLCMLPWMLHWMQRILPVRLHIFSRVLLFVLVFPLVHFLMPWESYPACVVLHSLSVLAYWCMLFCLFAAFKLLLQKHFNFRGRWLRECRMLGLTPVKKKC